MRLKNYLIEDYWNICIVPHSTLSIIDNPGLINEYKLIETSKDYFYADPFSFDDKSVLCEKFNFKSQTGSISKLKLDNNFNLIFEKDFIKNKTHFSFPFVTEINNEKVIIPENSEIGVGNIYDNKGSFLTNLLNEPIVDPVVTKHNGLFYLFCSLFDGSENYKLELYTSQDLKTWRIHPKSPIKESLAGARMAGNIINTPKGFYRFGQVCETSYGEYINVYKIEIINETQYKEVFVSSIKPPSGFIGLHTINQHNNVTLIDLKRNIISIKKPFQRLRQKYAKK